MEGVRWYPAGGDCMLAQQGGMLVDWSVEAQAPIGVVSVDADADEMVVELLDKDGKLLGPEEDGERAVAVRVRPRDGGGGEGREVQTVRRNAEGHFYAIYQPNKWAKQMEERERLAREALEGVVS